jgi:hypothetical protein
MDQPQLWMVVELTRRCLSNDIDVHPDTLAALVCIVSLYVHKMTDDMNHENKGASVVLGIQMRTLSHAERLCFEWMSQHIELRVDMNSVNACKQWVESFDIMQSACHLPMMDIRVDGAGLLVL